MSIQSGLPDSFNPQSYDAIVVGAVQLQFWDEIREELEKRKIACTFHRW